MKRVAVFGSTGSVGCQTLDVIRKLPDRFSVIALCAGVNSNLLARQIAEFSPRFFGCTNEDVASEFPNVKYMDYVSIASHEDVDIIVMAMSGMVALEPLMAGLHSGKSVVLANKEVMVISGGLIMAEAEKCGAQVLPVDSESSAIWQCLQGEPSPPRRFILTASGGAFRGRSWDSLKEVTPNEALSHPTWKMGRKITIDSATLVNKAFEVVENHWLFGLPFAKIDVVIHHQSIIHSIVEFEDGSCKAQVSLPDMRYPIHYGLLYPERPPGAGLPRWDPVETGALTFSDMDSSLYPCYELAMKYARMGGTWPAAFAGADEAVVDLFLEGRIKFTDMPDALENAMARHVPVLTPSLEDFREAAASVKLETLSRKGV